MEDVRALISEVAASSVTRKRPRYRKYVATEQRLGNHGAAAGDATGGHPPKGTTS
jgi:hypothetical protein